jgi:putative spermidine/putrescine transport system ATP-binding protein
VSSEATAVRRPGAEAGRGRDVPVPKLRRLAIRNLGKWYGDAAALRAFDLDVHGGEFISLLGPSGCGKTTALNCVAGLLEPDEGTIELDGRDLTKLPPERRGFGMVFQNYALFPHLTVGRNVAFGLEMMGLRREEISRRVTEALRLVQLADLAGRHPSQLSGGQQQRVALARAIVTEPRLLLMDEPLSNLDARLRVEMRTEIRRLHQSLGLTTLYVTHDQEEALSLSDRIVLLRGGAIQQVGTPEEVYGEPRSSYVAGFLGYRNLIPVTVEERGPDGVVVALPGGPRVIGTPQGDSGTQREAVAAVRPEDVEVLSADTSEPHVLRAQVELTEFVGNGFESSADVGGGVRMIARTPRRWPPGSAVALRIPRARLLIFPPE